MEVDPEWQMPSAAADVLVLAGDIEPGGRGLERFAGCSIPVVYVPGNHEYYHGEIGAVQAAMRHRARALGVHLLDDDETELGGVRFLGCTLWTDYELDGKAKAARRRDAARYYISDFSCIRHRGALLTPADTVAFHRRSVAWLRAKLSEPFAGPTVVVTHHAPLRRSVHPRWQLSAFNPAFASQLDDLMGKPALWIHGHTHDSFDYVDHGTRVVCNPKGYKAENRAFVQDLVLAL